MSSNAAKVTAVNSAPVGSEARRQAEQALRNARAANRVAAAGTAGISLADANPSLRDRIDTAVAKGSVVNEDV
jgi:hypothetical protein